jgi:hypothetical protein
MTRGVHRWRQIRRNAGTVRRARDELDLVQYGSDDTKTHRKIKHILGQKQNDRVGRLLVSRAVHRGAGGWSGFPSHKHDTDRLPDETRHDETYNFPLPARTTARACRCFSASTTNPATPITSSMAPRSDRQGLPPLRVLPGMRCTTSPFSAGLAALAEAVFPAHPCRAARHHPRHHGHGGQIQMTLANARRRSFSRP